MVVHTICLLIFRGTLSHFIFPLINISETKDIKITSAEKVKDTKRVEVGKKLGAISRQAKEKKASENGSTCKVESEFKLPTFDPLTAIGVVGVVGMVAYYGYCGRYRSSKESSQESPKDSPQVLKAQASPEKRKTQKSPVMRRELDTLD